MVGIYKITNIITQQNYIGQSIDIKQRWCKEKQSAFNPKSPAYNYPLSNAFRQYGLNNFTFDVVEECDKKDLDTKEIFYIKKYDGYTKGYNQNAGGHARNKSGPKPKLTRVSALQIIQILKTTTNSCKEIGQIFNVSGSTIESINNGKIWRQENEIYPIRIRKTKIVPKRKSTLNKKRTPPKTTNAIVYKCSVCGNEIKTNATYCRACAQIAQRRASRPTPLELAEKILSTSFIATGLEFGVSGKTIQNWCKSYNIPFHKKDLKKWYFEQMGIKEKLKEKDYSRAKRPVNQIDIKTNAVIATFDSQMAAAQFFNSKAHSHIGDVCAGKRKTAFGYKWSFT